MENEKKYFEGKSATPRRQGPSNSDSVTTSSDDVTGRRNGTQDLSGISSSSNNSNSSGNNESSNTETPPFVNSNLVTSPSSALNDLNDISRGSSTSTDSGCYGDGEGLLAPVNRSQGHGRGGRRNMEAFATLVPSVEVAHQQHQWNITQQQQQQQQYGVDSVPQTASMNTSFGPSASAHLLSSAGNTWPKQPVQGVNTSSSSISSHGSGPGGDNSLFGSLPNPSLSLESNRSILATNQGQSYIQGHSCVTPTLANRETESEGGGAEGPADLDPRYGWGAAAAAASNTVLQRSQSTRHVMSHDHANTMPDIAQLRTGIVQPATQLRLNNTEPIQNHFDLQQLAERNAFTQKIERLLEEALNAFRQEKLALRKQMMDFHNKQKAQRESFVRYVLGPGVDHDFNAILERLGGNYGERDTMLNDMFDDNATIQATATAARRRRGAGLDSEGGSGSREPQENWDDQITSKKDEY